MPLTDTIVYECIRRQYSMRCPCVWAFLRKNACFLRSSPALATPVYNYCGVGKLLGASVGIQIPCGAFVWSLLFFVFMFLTWSCVAVFVPCLCFCCSCYCLCSCYCSFLLFVSLFLVCSLVCCHSWCCCCGIAPLKRSGFFKASAGAFSTSEMKATMQAANTFREWYSENRSDDFFGTQEHNGTYFGNVIVAKFQVGTYRKHDSDQFVHQDFCKSGRQAVIILVIWICKSGEQRFREISFCISECCFDLDIRSFQTCQVSQFSWLLFWGRRGLQDLFFG